MKTYLTKIKLLLFGFAATFLLAGAASVSAIDYSGILNTNGNTRIFSGPGKVTTIQITADSVAAVTVNFYDAATNQIVYTNSAYTSYSSYITNLTTYYTNSQSQIVTNTRSALWTYAVSNAANTNVAYPVIASVTVPASTSITRTYDNLTILRGLTARCTGTNVTANISYSQ